MDAFVTPAPRLRHTTFLPPVHATTPQTIVMSLPPAARRAAKIWLRSITAQLPFRGKKKSLDYHTLTDPTPTLPDLRTKVVSVRPVSATGDHMQLTVEAPAALQHNRPGQFVRLARLSRHPASCLAVIASPPGSKCMDFLLARGADPCKLLSAKVGEELAVSQVMGDGLEYDHLESSDGDVFAFADSPQGFAAIKSLIEWGKFRAITGEGANRTNHVTIYYSLPGQRSVPYADRFSSWSVYGVNVIPLPGSSLMEYLSANAAVGTPKKNLAADFAVACVATEETFETLFCTLVLCGFRRKAIQKFSAEDVLLQSQDESADDDARESFEHGVWASWVRVREGMRADFEQKWAAHGRHERDDKRRRQEKEQAWASWSAQNRDQWTRVRWDDQAWSRYWSSWEDTNDKWKADPASSWKRETQGRETSWNQQSSQEYWDWVGRGTQRKKASGGGGGGDGRGRSYSEQYGGSTGWGNANNGWSGWEKGGYKYQYEEQQEKKGNNQYNQYQQGTNAGSGWSGWKRGSGRQASSGNTRNWTNIGKTEIDFYGVLGITAGANKKDIKKAYRKKAMQHHPDRNPDNVEEAHVIMKQIVVAWTVLKDDDKRRRYDAFGSNGL